MVYPAPIRNHFPIPSFPNVFSFSPINSHLFIECGSAEPPVNLSYFFPCLHTSSVLGVEYKQVFFSFLFKYHFHLSTTDYKQ
jgi:hypothetical protein